MPSALFLAVIDPIIYTKSYFFYYGVKFGVNANGFTHLNTGSNRFSQVAEYRLKV
ncbi:hypothetical protein PT23B2_03980 [Acinetobacter towneri]